jgi:hypothetical protein
MLFGKTMKTASRLKALLRRSSGAGNAIEIRANHSSSLWGVFTPDAFRRSAGKASRLNPLLQESATKRIAAEPAPTGVRHETHRG